MYAYWLSRNLNNQNDSPSQKPKFTITLPPPNVNGYLHVGHYLNATIHDILFRYNTIQGKSCEFIFGTDHGGISTEYMIKKELDLTKQTKYDLGREKYLEYADKFKEDKRENMIYQLKELGCLCSWVGY